MSNCQVMVQRGGGILVHCPEAAVARCSSGFRFCEGHKKSHGDGNIAHVIRAIPKREREAAS